MTAVRAEGRERLSLLLVLLLTVLALAVRLWGITSQSLWWDEVSSFQQARLGWGQLFAATAADNYPPLHNILLHLSMQLLGPTALALRLPSALLGAATIPALYWVGSRMAGRHAALIAAALLCVSGFHVWFSQEARMYALLCLTTVLFAGAALEYALGSSWRWALGSIGAGTLLLYSHPYGALNWASLVLAFGVAKAVRAKQLRSAAGFMLPQAAALVLYLPWALILLGRAKVLTASGFWLPPVTPDVLLYYFEVIMTGRGMLAALLLATALIALPAVTPQRERLLDGYLPRTVPAISHRSALWILLAWGVLPAGLGAILSYLTTPVLFHRYLIGSLPALLLLIGMGFARLPKSILGGAGVLCLAAAVVIGLVHASPGQRDDTRDVAAALATRLGPQDCVVMSPETAIAMSYYRPGGFSCAAIVNYPAAARFAVPEPDRIFVIANSYDQNNGWDAGVLGTVQTRQYFGITELAVVSPK